MPDTKNKLAEDPLDAPDLAPDPAHEKWLIDEIEKTLADKAAGKLTYDTLDEVAAELGIDAY